LFRGGDSANGDEFVDYGAWTGGSVPVLDGPGVVVEDGGGRGCAGVVESLAWDLSFGDGGGEDPSILISATNNYVEDRESLYKSEDPVSKSRSKICAGVPKDTGERYSLSYSEGYGLAVTVPELLSTAFLAAAGAWAPYL
jgi:hypothetical protein